VTQTTEIVLPAINAAKKNKSPHTLFLHRENGHVISFYDNLVYSLGLFRLKTAESILEGKILLEKLLKFQTPTGSFPLYLHEFPQTSDAFFPVKLLPLFFQIQSEFSSVIGKDVDASLRNVLKKLLTLAENEELTFPFALTLAVIKSKISNAALESALFDKAKEKMGEFSSQDWGQILYALSFLKEDEKPSFLVEEASFLYQGENGFIGPAHNEPHEGFYPKVSLIDLFLGKKIFPESAKIYPFAISESALGSRSYGAWKVVKAEYFALSYLAEKKESAYQKNAYLFRLLWGNRSSLVLPKATFPVSIKGGDGELEAVFDLPVIIPEENKEDMEAAFYLDASLALLFEVEGIKANTFRLNEVLTVYKDGMKIEAYFTCTKGEGKFFGHILKANRPAQKPPSHKGDFATYDWKIALRTISRTLECQLTLKLRWSKALPQACVETHCLAQVP
jgi:hypothetical protein